MKRSRPKLIPDKEYLFSHKRKQTFRAVFKRFVRAPGNDTLDEYYYECEVDANLSGNQWSHMDEEGKALILVRPSLVTLIQNAQADACLPQLITQRPPQPTPHQMRDSWVTECIHTIRSVFRNRKRT